MCGDIIFWIYVFRVLNKGENTWIFFLEYFSKYNLVSILCIISNENVNPESFHGSCEIATGIVICKRDKGLTHAVCLVSMVLHLSNS